MQSKDRVQTCFLLLVLLLGACQASDGEATDAGPDGIFDAGDQADGDAGHDADAGVSPAVIEAAADFSEQAVRWLVTYEDADDTVTIGGSQGTGTVAIRNAMRNAIRWTTSDPVHELDHTTNLGMCMSAYALKEAYAHLPSQQATIQRTLGYLQRALLASQQRSAGSMAQHAFPARPGASQYSAKTNAICGLAFIELTYFWSALVPGDASLASYRDDARAAALDIGVFLARLQEPQRLPNMPAGFALSSPPDSNGDGIYDGIFEEVANERLVPATATWGAMAGRFFHKLAGLGWAEVDAEELRARAAGMADFVAGGLALGAEHFSPRFTCAGAACADRVAERGASIAVVDGFASGPSSASGGDDAWHGRVSRFSGDTVLFDNLNGSDPVQWALNALFAIDPDARSDSSFGMYFAESAPQVHRTDGYYVIPVAERRDVFLGLGTYITHGRITDDGRFTLAADGTDIAHYVRKDGVWQIVTSHYGDNAVSGWNQAAWSRANATLFRHHDLSDPAARVDRAGDYDFDTLSHLAHWAMTIAPDGTLQAKVSATGGMTISSENMASMLCRALRVWHGTDACTM